MNKTFVIISISSRVQELNELVNSIIALEKFNDFDINLLFQDDLNNTSKITNKHRYKNIFIKDELLGCHGARVILLREMPKYDIYVNLDDDMLLTEYTNYEKAIEKALEKGTGFVLTNWARTEKLMLAKVPKMKDVFRKQVLVYQGGGMVYGEKIATLMRSLTPMKVTFDTEWSLTSYINGYSNYRFQGSLAIHKVCGKGGMSEFMRTHPALTNLDEYVTYRKARKTNGSGKDLLIPLDSDLKPLAHLIHNYKKSKLNENETN